MSKKLAVCVGLNYPGTSAALSGCINDMNDWADELTRRGYEARRMAEPTKAELVAELRGLIGRARYRDKVVFTYSGHGTWLPDRDGDEADGRDEALVLKDYRAGGLLTDDELLQIFGEAKFGVRRLIISDSCHSGTVSRSMDPVGDLQQEGLSPTPRFIAPAEFLDPDSPQYKAALAVEDSTARSVPRKGTVLLSGCADEEYSYDARFNGRPNGAMSYFALQALKAGATTVREVHRHVRAQLPSTSYPQSPQLSALPHQARWNFL